MMQDSPKTGTGDLLISVQAIEPLKVPIPNPETEQQIERLLQTKEYDEINRIVYELYNLTKDEIEFISSL
jgi:hypothetical protein